MKYYYQIKLKLNSPFFLTLPSSLLSSSNSFDVRCETQCLVDFSFIVNRHHELVGFLRSRRRLSV